MRAIHTAGLIAIGVVIGVAGTASLRAGQGQGQRAGRIVNPRLIVTETTKSDLTPDPVFFVRDTQSAGCWLELYHGPTVSLAVAPPEACKASAAESPASPESR